MLGAVVSRLPHSGGESYANISSSVRVRLATSSNRRNASFPTGTSFRTRLKVSDLKRPHSLTAQFATSVPGTDENLKIMAEVAALLHRENSTKAADLYAVVRSALEKHRKQINMSAVSADGVHALLRLQRRNNNIIYVALDKENLIPESFPGCRNQRCEVRPAQRSQPQAC